MPVARAYSAQFEHQLYKGEDEGHTRKRLKLHEVKDTPHNTALVNGETLDSATSSLEATIGPAKPATETRATVPPRKSSSAEAIFRRNISEHPINNAEAGPSLPPGDSSPRPASPSRAIDPAASPQDSATEANQVSSSNDCARNYLPSEPSDAAPPLSVHFYLHAPRLPSPRPVLIPLPPEATLTGSLRSRLVLEFPTIYVRHEPLDNLGKDYISEEAFSMRMQAAEYRETIEARLTGKEEGQVIEKLEPVEDNVDERKLEGVLKRDLKSFRSVAV